MHNYFDSQIYQWIPPLVFYFMVANEQPLDTGIGISTELRPQKPWLQPRTPKSESSPM